MNKAEILENLDIESFYRSLLPSLKANSKPETVGLCPFHTDSSPSLSVNVETGLFRCFSCDAKGDVFTFFQRIKSVNFPTALQEIGKMAGIAGVESVKPKVVAKFEYKDSMGKTLYVKERIEPGRNGRSKEFVFKHLEGDKWVLGRGCEPVLYNLPQITTADCIFVVEGEAKADLLNLWGLIATCLDSGANSPWQDKYTKTFEGKEKVVILPDNDKPGREHAAKIASALHGKVKETKVIEFSGFQEKGDIINWARIQGNNKAKLIEIIKNTPEWTPKEYVGKDKADGAGSPLCVVSIRDFLSMEFPARENILAPWLNTQGLAMVHGIRGLGKTFFVIGVSVAVTSGGSFLKWKANKPCGVLHLDGEMPAVALQERYCQFVVSNDLETTAPLKIITPDLQELGMPDLSCNTGREALEPHLEGVSLVIVDNISTLCKGGRENEAESWLPIQEWALRLRTRGISVLFVHHAGKAGQQRGTSRREDVLDTVISLKRPADYEPDDGARFDVHFEKARGIYGDDVKPFEAMLITGIDGKQRWVTKDLEESTTEKVVKLLSEGMSQNEIAEELKISKGTVSKHKQKAKDRKLL